MRTRIVRVCVCAYVYAYVSRLCEVDQYLRVRVCVKERELILSALYTIVKHEVSATICEVCYQVSADMVQQ